MELILDVSELAEVSADALKTFLIDPAERLSDQEFRLRRRRKSELKRLGYRRPIRIAKEPEAICLFRFVQCGHASE
jgi:hypothetical protein